MDPCLLPLEPNPDGSPPNFKNPPTLLPLNLESTLPVLVLTVLCALARCSESWRKHRKLWADDYCCLAAIVLFLFLWPLELLVSRETRHAWDTSRCYQSLRVKEMTGPHCLLYIIVLFISKASVALLYLRMFSSIQWIRYTIWINAVLFSSIYLSAIPIIVYYNFPFGKHEGWDSRLGEKAMRSRYFPLLAAGVTIINDVIMVTLPIRPVMRLNRSLRTRLGLLAAFAAGTFATAMAVTMLYYRVIWRFNINTHDLFWKMGLTGVFSDLEIVITLFVSCIPGAASAWRHVLQDTTLGSRLRSFFASMLPPCLGAPQSTTIQSLQLNDINFRPSSREAADGEP